MKIKKLKMKKNDGMLFKAIVFPVLFIWALTLIYPFVWSFINTFKTPVEYLEDSFVFPEQWLFSNWIKAFEKLKVELTMPGKYANLFDMIFNSVWWTLGAVVLSNAITMSMAYAISKYKYKMSGVLYTMNLIIMTIPIVGAFPSQYRFYKMLGIINSPTMLVTTMGCMGSANLMLYYSFFKSISWTYAEAVFIDGGSDWTVFFKIMIPLATPIVTALVILSFISYWNDYFTALVFLRDFPTLATGLYIMSVSSSTKNNMPLYLSAVLLSVVPTLVIFCCFSSKIMNSVSIGGIKG